MLNKIVSHKFGDKTLDSEPFNFKPENCQVFEIPNENNLLKLQQP